MARVKKQLLELIAGLSTGEIRRLHAKLVGPRLKSLQREKAAIEKRLRQVERRLAGLVGVAPRKQRKAKVGRPPAKRGGRAKRGSVLAGVKRVLENAGGSLRVKEICDGLVRSGIPRKVGLKNYVSRMLSTNPAFTRAGWGLYRLAAKGLAPVGRKPGRKKAEAPVAAK